MPLEDFERQLDAALLTSIAIAEERAAPIGPDDIPLYDVLRYHLGFVNDRFEPERVIAGKRIRPRIAALTCAAAGGDPDRAIHAAAAVELLHNFTLIHDDIQDQSVYRRHRRTVWDLWGTAQAINAGDAMFAISHLALNRSLEVGVDAATVLDLSNALHTATLRIVEGQVLDLGFEQRSNVSADDYLTMIAGKTGALAYCASWTGARIAGVDGERLDRLGDFGATLGVGFQIRDDILGIWGTTDETGKAEADDIRRRKKSLPVLLLRERADPDEQATLEAIYANDDVSAEGIATVLAMLRRHEIEPDVQDRVRAWHDRARDLLDAAVGPSPVRDELIALVESLESRAG